MPPPIAVLNTEATGWLRFCKLSILQARQKHEASNVPRAVLGLSSQISLWDAEPGFCARPHLFSLRGNGLFLPAAVRSQLQDVALTLIRLLQLQGAPEGRAMPS